MVKKKLSKEREEILDEIYAKKPKLSEKEMKKIIRKNFKEILEILKKYEDMDKDVYTLVAVWIIGTYFHNKFNSYPYLFFNAMKGGGKSRLINLITTLSWKGMVLNSITEAVLFRTIGTLGIDEFEGISRKGNENLKELLNSAYKKIGFVIRMKKVKGESGENQEAEKFPVYRPIVMANIQGMEEVLGDRSIETILERSAKPEITKLIEDFETNSLIQGVIKAFSLIEGSLGSFMSLILTQQKWNEFVIKYYEILSGKDNKTLNSLNSLNSLYSQYSQYSLLFKRTIKADLLGRDLELFLPLYLIAELCGCLEEMITISIKITKEKKERDTYEGKDVQVYDFVADYKETSFVRMSKLTNEFRLFLGLDEKQDLWVNNRWLGKSLKRLKLIQDKKKVSGIMVILNIDKAKEKIKMFREPEEKENKIETVKMFR